MTTDYILYISASLIFGVAVLLIVRLLGDFPFPWEIRRITASASEPDSLALSECFDKLSDNEEIHLTAGNISHLVCEQDIVINSLEKALRRDVVIKLIHGPNVDTRSTKFLNLIRESNKAELYQYPKVPEMHFRVLIDAKGPREVYVEEPHHPFTDNGFRRIHSRKASSEYEKVFQAMLQTSRAS